MLYNKKANTGDRTKFLYGILPYLVCMDMSYKHIYIIHILVDLQKV